MVHDLADHINRQVTLTPEGSGKIRVFEISKDGRRQKEFTGTEMLNSLNDSEMYAEVNGFINSMIVCLKLHRTTQEIPMDELEARESDKIIDVFHFTKEPSRTHGVPFRFIVRPVRHTI